MKLEDRSSKEFIVGNEKLNDKSIEMDNGLYLNEKPFDISKYEFSDLSWDLNSSDDECVSLYDTDSLTEDGDCNEVSINKQDAEAIAKHFKLI